MSEATITRELYEAFQRVELERWNDIIDANVEINSPAGWGMSGLDTLKGWEQGKRKPDAAAANFLRVIKADPKFVQRILAA